MYNANTAERQRDRQKGLPRQVFELDEVAEERSSQGDSVSAGHMDPGESSYNSKKGTEI